MLYTSWDADDIPEMMGEPVIKAMCLQQRMTAISDAANALPLTGDFRGERGLLELETEKGL